MVFLPLSKVHFGIGVNGGNYLPTVALLLFGIAWRYIE
jgi:hypothetical protein